jgi:hypothetical protein
MSEKKNVELSIFERLRLVGDYLPKVKGSFLTLKLANETIQEIGITQDEITEYSLEVLEDGRLKFDQSKLIVDGKPVVKSFEIADAVYKAIGGILKQQSNKEELGFETYSLYEKFVEVKEEKE